MADLANLLPGSGPPSAAEPAGAQDLQQTLRQAEQLERAGRLAEAEPLYRKLLQAVPDNAALAHNLGALLAARGQLVEAALLLRRAVAGQPGEPSFHNSLGTVLQRQGGLDQAEACYRQALSLQPGYAEAHFNLGALLEQLNRPAEALREYRAAVAARPQYARAMTRIGAILHVQTAHQEALGELDRAVKAAPHFFDALYYRGSTLSTLGRHDEALADLARATALRPDSFEALLAQANALRDAGRNEPALAVYWKALEMRPGFADLHEALNTLAWSAGRRDLYLRSFELARQKHGIDPDLLLLEAAFRFRNAEYAQAEELLWQALGRAPQRADLMGFLARILAQQGRFEEAHALFERAIAAEPEVMVHRQEYGFALLRDGQAGAALDVFEQALLFSPYDQIALAGLALAYREQGDSRYQQLMDPRYIRTYDLDIPAGFADAAAFNQALTQELMALHTTKVEPINQTLRGGTQTTGQLFAVRTPLIQQVRASLEAAVADYVRTLPPDPLHPLSRRRTEAFDFSGSWSCQLASQGFHANHVHHKGWISSAYYVALPEGVEDAGRRHGWLKFGESNLALGGSDQPDSFVQPVIGRLVLFPSFFWHGTVPFADAGRRISIAFDALPRPPQRAMPAPA
jgi:tetratricopeptide (TPR) repeat protein